MLSQFDEFTGVIVPDFRRSYTGGRKNFEYFLQEQGGASPLVAVSALGMELAGIIRPSSTVHFIYP